MADGVVLNPVMRQNLLAIKHTTRLVDRTSDRLATGLEVNRALDNPQNFFAAQQLNNRAGDLSRMLDGIGSSIRTVQQSIQGVQSIERLLNLAESDIVSTLEDVRANGLPPVDAGPSVPPLSDQITADNPAAYWRLGDLAGAALNQGSIGASVNGTYQNNPTRGAAPLYDGGGASVDLNGTNQSISIPNNTQINTGNHAQRTVELVFNADDTSGRQVLYEEGGTTNAFSIYILNGNLHVTGRDAGAWGPANISTTITAGETYHVSFTFDFPGGRFTGYVNGEEIGSAAVNAVFPSHSAAVAIGRMANGSWFHDGAQSGDNFFFDGRISDVALYNAVLTPEQMQDRAAAVIGEAYTPAENPGFSEIIDQINAITEDANYRGVNLLAGENLNTYFNEDRNNFLVTEGVDFTTEGLGIARTDFNVESEIEEILIQIRSALEQVRSYGGQLANDLNIITHRRDFTEGTINTLESGAQDLVQADMNAEGANLLASQTRLELATTSLSLGSQASANVLNLFV